MDFPLNTRPTIPFHDHPDYRRMVAKRNLRRATTGITSQPVRPRSTSHAVKPLSELLKATLDCLMTRKQQHASQGSFAVKRHADQENEGALLPPLRPRVRFSPITQAQRPSSRNRAFRRKVKAEQKDEGLLLATSPRCRRVRFVPSIQPPRLRLLSKKFQRKVQAEMAREREMLLRIRENAGRVYTTADDAPALPPRTVAGSALPAQQCRLAATTMQQSVRDPNRATRPDAMMPYLRDCPRFKARVAELMALQANPLPPVTYEKTESRSFGVASSPLLVGKQKDLVELAPLVLPEAGVDVGREGRCDSVMGVMMQEGDDAVRDSSAGLAEMKDCLGSFERDVQPLDVADMGAIDAVASAADPVPALPKPVFPNIREIEERDVLGESEAMVHPGWYEEGSSVDGLLRDEENVGSDGVEGERVGWEVVMRRKGEEVYEGW